MKRILFLEHNVDGTVGGSHFCLLEIVRLLDRRQFQPIVWFFRENSLVEEFRKTGAEVVIEKAPPPILLPGSRAPVVRSVMRPVQSVTNYWNTSVRLKGWWGRRLRRYRVDAVHLNNSCAGDYGLQLAARGMGIPCVAHQRGFPIPALNKVTKGIAEKLDSIIAISNSIRDNLLRSGLPPERIPLVFDGIDPARVEASSHGASLEGIELAPDARVIGIVGNLKEWKGQEVVVRAMEKVVAAEPRAVCLIVGSVADQAYADRLQRIAKELGVSDNVIFCGYRKQPAAVMRRMEVVLHASIDPEPFGIVLLEGMCLGKPVIASAHGGPMDIVSEGETGFLTPPRDHEALAARIVQLLRDPQLREKMGKAGRERLLSLFTAERNVRSVEAIHNSLVSAPARARA